jgi:hypothetical protein
MKTGLVILGVVTAVAAVAVQRDVALQATVDRRYEGADGKVVEGLGACSITTDDVSCWNMDGVVDKALAERVKAFLLSSSNDIQFAFGRKNRWLVVRQSPSSGGNFELPRRGYVQSFQLSYRGNESSENIVRVIAEPGETQTALIASMYLQNNDKPAEIPFKAGSVSTVKNMRIEIGTWKEAAKRPQTPFDGSRVMQMQDSRLLSGRNWAVPIGQTTVDQSARVGVTFTPLDSLGRVIAYVDKNGKPASGVRVLESTDPTQPDPYGRVSSKKYVPAVFGAQGQQLTDAAMYGTNIDPRQIASLRVGFGSLPFRVQINGFPLDPAK